MGRELLGGMYNVGLPCYLACVAPQAVYYVLCQHYALPGKYSVAQNDNACTAFSLYVAAAYGFECVCCMFLERPAITAMSNQQSETDQWLVGARSDILVTLAHLTG